jgi:hypothetical protein
MLQSATSRRIFDQVKDNTSSLLVLHDTKSLGSYKTETGQDVNNVNTTFDFDSEVFASNVYQKATRSNMIFAIQTGAQGARGLGDVSPPPSYSSRPRTSRTASMSSTLLEGADDFHSRRPLVHRQYSDSSASPPPKPDPRMMKFSANQGGGRQEASPDNRTTRMSIRSSIMGNMSVLRFARRRDITPLPKQLTMTPSQAPMEAKKVLLLGASGSGKSTLLKSLTASFGHFDTETRRSYREAIYENTVQYIQFLTAHVGSQAGDSELEENRRTVTGYYNRLVEGRGGNGPMPSFVSSAISALWNHPRIGLAFEDLQDKHYYLLESAEQ